MRFFFMSNPRVWNRKLHRWGAIAVALPFLVVISTGILLQVKKQASWVQPAEQKGTPNAVAVPMSDVLEAVRAIPEAGMREWTDIDRIDIRPKKGLVKVIGFSRWEVQLDAATGAVLQTAYRRSDLIESLHDGSWFHDSAKLWIFLPTGVIVLGLWLTGIYLFLLPIRTRRAKARGESLKGPVTTARAAALTLAMLGALGGMAVAPRALSAQPAAAEAPPALVLVVRHAEKADNSSDPVLSAQGSARGDALAKALEHIRIDHVIVTPLQRTRLTAASTMTAYGLQPEVVGLGPDMATHIANIAAAVRRQSGKVVLVVGHSNTVPAIVHALGGPKLPDLCETYFGALFTVMPSAPGAPARVVVSNYGIPDPPGADRCP